MNWSLDASTDSSHCKSFNELQLSSYPDRYIWASACSLVPPVIGPGLKNDMLSRTLVSRCVSHLITTNLFLTNRTKTRSAKKLASRIGKYLYLQSGHESTERAWAAFRVRSLRMATNQVISQGPTVFFHSFLAIILKRTLAS